MASGFAYSYDDVVKNTNPSTSTGADWRSAFNLARNNINNLAGGYSVYSALQDQNRGNRNFSLSGGTQNLYNDKRVVDSGNLTDNFFLSAKETGDWWNNLAANVTGNQDLAFDPSKFGSDPLGTVGKFALNLPGMFVGAIPTGAADLGEVITGNPYHEATKNEQGNWYIPDYQLDASQRAASLGNAVINIGGMLTGGAGRVVGGAGKIASAGLGAAGKVARAEKVMKGAERAGDAFGGLSKGVATRIYESSMKSQGKEIGKTGLGIGLALDAADEGVEEFGQSYLDDIRYKSLDEGSFGRAFESGVWGAAGGLMMGGLGRGASALAEKANKHIYKDKIDSILNEMEISDPETREALWSVPQQLRQPVLSRLNNVARTAINDELVSGSTRKAQGAGLGMQIGTDSTLKFNDIVPSTENIRAIYLTDPESAKKVAATFGTTTEVLDTIFKVQNGIEPEYHGARGTANCLNKILEESRANGHIAKVALGRNPDTKYGGFYLNIARVEEGSGHRVNPLVMAILGSDFDADKSSIYYDPDNTTKSDNQPRLNVNGYPIDMLIDPESGKSTVDWLYYGLDEWTKFGSENSNRLKELVSKQLEPYKEYKVQLQDGNYKGIDEYFANRFDEVFRIKDLDKRSDELSRVIIELASKIDEARAKGFGIEALGGMDIAEELIQNTFADPTELIQNYGEMVKSQFVSNVAEQSGEDPAVVEAWWSKWTAPGSLGDNTKIFQMTDVLGLLSYALGDKGNPIFRQYGMLLYGAKSKPAVFKEITELFSQMRREDMEGSTTAVDRLIRESFRMCIAGEDPQTTIEGIINSYMYAEIVARTDLYNHSIDSQQALDNFIDVLIDVQAKWTKDYNRWGKANTAAGWDENYFSIYKTPLTKNSSPAEIYRVFTQVFGGAKISDLFSSHAIPTDYQYLTLNQFIDRLYQNYSPTTVKMVLSGADPRMSQIIPWIDGLVKSHEHQVKRVHKEFEAVFDGINLNGVKQRMKANGDKLDPRDEAAVLQLFDALHLVIGDRASCYLRLFASDEFLNTELGQLILDAKTSSDMLNIARCASIRAQFQQLAEWRFGEDESLQSKAIEYLESMKSISLLHHVIAKTLQDGNRNLFDTFTDPSNSLESASKDYRDFASENTSYSDADLLVDSLRSSNDQFELNSLSKRAKDSGKAIKTFSEIVHEHALAEAEDWVNVAQHANSEGSVVRWAYDMAEFLECEVASEIGAMEVYASLTGDISYAEKARNTDAALATYICNQYSHLGGVVSHLSAITENLHGHLDKSQWLNNRYHIVAAATNPEYRQEVWDEQNNCQYIVTFSSFWEQVYKKAGREGQFDPKTKTLNQDMLITLFKTYPQFCGYFAPSAINITNAAGNVTASVARKTSVAKSLQDYIEKSNAHTTEEYQDNLVERSIRVFSIQLNANSWFKQAVVRALEPHVLSGEINMRQLSREYKRVSEQMAFLLYRQGVELDRGGLFRKEAQDIFDDYILSNELELYSSLRDIISTYTENLESQMMDGIGEAAIEDALRTSANMRILSQCSTKLGIKSPEPHTYNGEVISEGAINSIIDYYNQAIRILSAADVKQKIEPMSRKMKRIYEMDRDRWCGSLEAGIRENIKNNPNSKYKNYTDDQIAKVAETAYEEFVKEELAQYNELGEFILFTDEDLKDENSLRIRLEELYKGNQDALDKIDGDIAIIFDNGKQNLEKRSELVKVVQKTVVKNLLKTGPQKLGIHVNIHALSEMQEMMDALERTVRLAVEQTRSLHGNKVFPNDIKIVDDYAKRHGIDFNAWPVMDFVDPIKQSSCANMKVSHPAAGNPSKVEVNGAMAKAVAGLSHLDTHIAMDYSYPIQLTPREIITMLDRLGEDYNRVQAEDENGRLRNVGSIEYRTEIEDRMKMGDDRPVNIYLPTNNAHGTTTANMLPALSDRNAGKHRFPEIIGRIICAEMEDMVLKAKKKYHSIDYIIVNKKPSMAGEYARSINDFNATNEDQRILIRKMFIDFRNNYARSLTEQFTEGELRSLGFGSEQALIVAQGLTPGVRVELVATNPKTGESIKYFEVIDASCFVGSEEHQRTSYQERMIEILEPMANGSIPQILSFEPLSVSPQQVANRITRAVNRAYIREGRISKKIEYKAARVAMEDWSDYGTIFTDANLDNLLSSVPHVSYARKWQFIAPDTPTRYQGFYHNGFGGKIDESVVQNSYKYASKDPKSPDYSAHVAMKKKYEAGKLPVLVTRSFIQDKNPYEDIDRYSGENLLYMNLQDVSNLKEIPEGGKRGEVKEEGGYGFIIDESKADEAVTWARGASTCLVMPESLYKKKFQVYGKRALRGTIAVNGISEPFVIVDTNASRQWANPARRSIQAASEPRDSTRIMLTAVVHPRYYRLGDAEAAILPSGKMFNATFQDKGYKEITLKNIGNSEVSFMDLSEANMLLHKLANQDPQRGWVAKEDKDIWADWNIRDVILDNKKHIGNIDSYDLNQRVVDYLADLVKDPSRRNAELSPSDIRSGAVIRIVVTSGGKYIPIIAPDMPVDVVYAHCSLNKDNTVGINYFGSTSIASQSRAGATKIDLVDDNGVGENGKFMASIYDRGDDGFSPMVGGLIPVDMLVSSDTQLSRTYEMSDSLIKSQLYHAMLLPQIRGSFVFTLGEDGKTPDWNDYIKNNEKWTDEKKRKFLGPEWRDVVKEIANGQLHIVDPEKNFRADEIIADICRTYVLQHNGDFFDIFSSYRCELDENGRMIRVANDSNFADDVQYGQFMLAFHGFESDDILKLFHVMNHQLRINGGKEPICPNGKQDMKQGYLFNKNGDMLVSGGTDLYYSGKNAEAGDERALRKQPGLEKYNQYFKEQGMSPIQEMVYIPIRLSFVSVLNESTYNKTPTMSSAISPQHMYMRGLDNGYLTSDLRFAQAYEASLFGDIDQALRYVDKQYSKRHDEAVYGYSSDELDKLLMHNVGSREEVKNRREIADLARAINERTRRLREYNGEDAGYLSSEEQSEVVFEMLDYVYKQLGKRLSYQQLDILVRHLTGTTPSLNGRGIWEVDAETWRSQVKEVVQNIKDYGMPVKIKHNSSSRADGRFEIPLISQELINTLWEFDDVKAHFESKEEFIDAIKEEQTNAEKNLTAHFTDNEMSKEARMRHRALQNFAEAARMLHNETSSIFIFNGIPFKEAQKGMNSIAKELSKAEEWSTEEQELFEKLSQLSDDHFDELRRGFERRGFKEFTRTGPAGDIDCYKKVSDAKNMARILNDWADVSRVMSLLNPFIIGANLADRAIHQGGMKLALHIARVPLLGRINPHYSKNWMNQEIVKKAVNSELAIKLWNSYRMMEFTSDETAFLAENADNNIEGLIEWIDKRNERLKSEGTKFHQAVGHMSQIVFEKSTGGTALLKQQMENFLNEFVVFAEANGQDFWFKPVAQGRNVGEKKNERPMMIIEEVLSETDGFAKFFNSVILGRKNNLSYTIAMQAMNSAKTGDMAQRNALAMLIKYYCSKVPGGLGNFLLTTAVTRFPDYSINKMERVLNLILPMSSIRYVFTEHIANTQLGKELGVGETQIHAGLKQAVLSDVIHLGLFNTALILYATSQAIEPPDDDELWGNVQEWKILGFQANPPWWIEDALGFALPMAVFWKSCDLGKPRPDILMNGLSNYLYNNPLVKVEAFAELLADPYGAYMDTLEEEDKRYSSVAGGPPTAEEAGAIIWRSAALNYISQFFTPAIVRDIARSDAMDREKDYKHIIDENGNKVAVTYDDASLRYATRKNPVLGFLVGAIKGGDWSYLGPNMPNTEYYDDYQYAMMQKLSVKGLSDEERIAKVNDIITTLASYDNMEELAETGFFLDNETLQAVASQVWDNYHYWDEWYYQLQSEGKLDYYIAGDGDYTLGMERVGKIKSERNMWKQYWYNFYYDKLKSSEISGELDKYTRHNTRYAQDVYGNWYNTGQATNFLGLTSVYGDSISTATGQVLYDENGHPIRAFIPEKTQNRDLGTLESWSANGDGNSYSKQYQNIYGTSGNLSSANMTTEGSSSGGNSRRSGYGGGGGYRGSGGSGGSSSSYKTPPRIYGYNANVYPTSPSRVMNTDRKQEANFDYLRPGFETKGSREAYKRSDI